MVWGMGDMGDGMGGMGGYWDVGGVANRGHVLAKHPLQPQATVIREAEVSSGIRGI